METTLKFDRVILIKELNDKIKKVGEVFEIANVLEDSFLLRESKTKLAVGVISFTDFEKHFVHEQNFRGWTDWTPIIGFNGQSDAVYRTNRKKIQLKFLTNKVRAESCCNNIDDFNLTFGLNLAYLRALNKAYSKKVIEYENELKRCENELKRIDREMIDNERIIKQMVNSLEA